MSDEERRLRDIGQPPTARNMTATMMDGDFISDLKGELHRARQKFPSSNLSFAALVEEVGELAQAMLQWRTGEKTEQNIWNEAVQVAAMAMRVAIDGDPSFTSVPYIKHSGLATSDSDYDAD